MKSNLYIKKITSKEVKPFILNIHYARRMPQIKYAYGLFKDKEMVGVITYGIPASPSLCKGIAGKKNFQNVLELNRLVILPEYNGKNYASYFISHTLKLLPSYTFVVSYADTGWSHIGYVYQATNWLYTGASKQRLDRFSDGNHPRHYDKNETRYQIRTSKHRYVYLVGTKRQRKQMLKELNYPIMDYPKGDEVKYDVDNPVPVQSIEIVKKINIP